MRLGAVLFTGIALAFGAAACATDSGGGNDRASDTGGGAATGGPGAGGGAAAGAGGGNFGNTNTRGAAPMETVVLPGDDGNCGATSMEAETVTIEEQIEVPEEVTTVEPVAFYIMLDQSFSMVGLWPGAVAGVNAFVTDPMSDGIDVAMDFFPALFGDTGACDGSGFDTPKIPMGRLPGQAATITSTLGGMPLPTGIGTPIEGALRGVTRFCENFQAMNPDEKCIAVLVTDGKPEINCDLNLDNNVAIATQAHAAGVTTYAVGLNGADFGFLDRVAMEGGAEDCDPGAHYACDITANSMDLVVALNKIRESVVTVTTHTETVTKTVQKPLACEFLLPAPDNLQQGFDKDEVNVRLTGTGIPETTLGRVPTKGDCAADAWYYDDPAKPTRIIACPATCDAIQSAEGAKIDILLGCPTIIIG